MAGPLKVCLVGPERTGKSFLSKLLAEQSVPEEEVYQPTAGVRWAATAAASAPGTAALRSASDGGDGFAIGAAGVAAHNVTYTGSGRARDRGL